MNNCNRLQEYISCKIKFTICTKPNVHPDGKNGQGSNGPILGFFLNKAFEIRHFKTTPYNKWSALMDTCRLDIHDSLSTIKSHTSCLLR